MTFRVLSLHPRWPKFVPRSDSNPIQAESNPIESNPNRSKTDPIRPTSTSGSVHGHSRSDPDGHARSEITGNHPKPSQLIRNHPKPSERKPSGLSIGQSKCVVLLYLSAFGRLPHRALGRGHAQFRLQNTTASVLVYGGRIV